MVATKNSYAMDGLFTVMTVDELYEINGGRIIRDDPSESPSYAKTNTGSQPKREEHYESSEVHVKGTGSYKNFGVEVSGELEVTVKNEKRDVIEYYK